MGTGTEHEPHITTTPDTKEEQLPGVLDTLVLGHSLLWNSYLVVDGSSSEH